MRPEGDILVLTERVDEKVSSRQEGRLGWIVFDLAVFAALVLICG